MWFQGRGHLKTLSFPALYFCTNRSNQEQKYEILMFWATSYFKCTVTAHSTCETIFKFGLLTIGAAHFCWRFMKNASVNSLFRLNLYYKDRHRNTTVILPASSFYFHNLIEVTKAALEESQKLRGRIYAICLHWPLILWNACYTILSFHGSTSVIIHSEKKRAAVDSDSHIPL